MLGIVKSWGQGIKNALDLLNITQPLEAGNLPMAPFAGDLVA